MTFQFCLVGVEVVDRIQLLVAIELESVPWKLLVPDLVTVFITEPVNLPYSALKLLVIRRNSATESASGIMPGAHIFGLIDFRAVYQEGVGKLRLTIRGHIARRAVEAGSRRAIVVTVLTVFEGATPGCRASRSRYERPLSGMARICEDEMVVPIEVFAVSTCTVLASTETV